MMTKTVFQYAEEQGIVLSESQKSYLFGLMTGQRTFALVSQYDREIAEELFREFTALQDEVVDSPTT